MANIEECEHFGIDPKKVERFENRIARLLSDMKKEKLSIFCGSTGTIRADDWLNDQALIVGHIRGHNHDGGCGACRTAEDGLMRGE